MKSIHMATGAGGGQQKPPPEQIPNSKPASKPIEK